MWIARLGNASGLVCAALLAGCQLMPESNPVEPAATTAPVPAAEAPLAMPAPPAAAAKQERALASHISRTYAVDDDRASHVVRAASSASRSTGLPRTLILAVIAVESSFDPMAVSRAGARGLMQVLPKAHPEKVSSIGGKHMLHDVDTGVRVGSRILFEYRRTCGNLRTALVRYSGAARNYAGKVLARKRYFDRVEAAAASPLRIGLLWAEEALARIGTADSDADEAGDEGGDKAGDNPADAALASMTPAD